MDVHNMVDPYSFLQNFRNQRQPVLSSTALSPTTQKYT